MTAAIVGWAHTPFGKLDAVSVESLIVQVAREALDLEAVIQQSIETVRPLVDSRKHALARQGVFNKNHLSIGPSHALAFQIN